MTISDPQQTVVCLDAKPVTRTPDVRPTLCRPKGRERQTR